jgi:flagellar basal body-associated protein FliL
MYNKKNKHNITKKRIGIITVCVIALLAIVGGSLAYLYLIKKPTPNNFANNNSTQSENKPENEINYSPPTATDKSGNDTNKDKIVEQKNSGNNQSPQYTVVISYSGQDPTTKAIEVDAFVTGLVEDNGSCTLNAYRGSESVSKTVKATRNAQVTNCEPITFALSEFPSKGTWSAVVTYKSPTTTTDSIKTNIEVE